MPLSKPLSRAVIETAMANTKSNRAASRYSRCSYTHYKSWAKQYIDEESGKSLFELHKNQSGKGIPKFLNHNAKEPALIDIIEGRTPASSFNPEKLKYRLITEGFLKESCNCCGFEERRVIDYKIPLILHFKDKNTNNYFADNIEMLCYNCYYLRVGDVFNDKDIQKFESGVESTHNTSENVDMDLDDYTKKRFIELGLMDIEEDEANDLISRI